MTTNLKPLFSSETPITALTTIDANLQSIASRLCGDLKLTTDERLRLLEFAVTVEDSETRSEIVAIVNLWKYAVEKQLEARASIEIVRRQLESIKPQLAPPQKPTS